VRQELQVAVDQLPEDRREAGQHLQGGGGHHHQAPRHPREQVPSNNQRSYYSIRITAGKQVSIIQPMNEHPRE
jgi:hypothetical protein